MYDEAADELRYAQTIWGDLGADRSHVRVDVSRSRASRETGSRQFSLYRGSINAMKRAYPQYPDRRRRTAAARDPADHLSDRVLGSDSEVLGAERPRSVPGRRADVPGVDVRRQHPIACEGRRPDAARGRRPRGSMRRRLGIAYSSTLLTKPELNIRIGDGVSGRSAARVRQTVSACWPPITPATAASRRWVPERPDLLAGRVHRRHPVLRDAGLRAEDPRDGRGLPPSVRRRTLACVPTTRCRRATRTVERVRCRSRR